jgi:hypothetical protein
MKISTRLMMVFAASLLVAACSPARTGVVNSTLTTNQRPAISIEPQAPLRLADSGRVWVSPRTDVVPGMATASFDYAVYTDPAASASSVLAYAAIIRLEDRDRWMFAPQGKALPGSFGNGKKFQEVCREGFLYTLHVPGAGDWVSELLTANGKAVPEAWIAKRWVFSLDSELRGLAEYREPWPADFDVPALDIVLLRPEHADFLREFDSRAQAAFGFSPESQEFSGPPPSAAWTAAPVHPDVARLVGEVLAVDNSGNDYE